MRDRGAPTRAAVPVPVLRRLIWVCLMPILLWSAWLAVGGVRTLEERLEREAAGLARNLAAALDADLDARIGALRVLALAPRADDPGRRADLYREALRAREVLGTALILADPGPPVTTLFDTRVPFASPRSELDAEAGRAVAMAADTGRAAVADPAADAPAGESRFAVAVPLAEGRPPLVLLALVDTGLLARRLDRLAVPDGWSVVLRDGQGAEIARRWPAGVAPGSARAGSGAVLVRSQVAPWSLVLEVPRSEHRVPLIAAAMALGVGLLGALLVGALGAALAARRWSASCPPVSAPAQSSGAVPETGAGPDPETMRTVGTATGPVDVEALVRARHGGTRVLVAEDNPVSRAVASDLLQGAGLLVDTAEDGREALARVQTGDYALILMDVQMPDLDGLAAARAVRALPGWERRPILAMTAGTAEADRQACRAAGMDGFLAKPVDPTALFAALLEWLPRSEGAGAGALAPGVASAAPAPTSAPAPAAATVPALGPSGRRVLERLAGLPGLDLDPGLGLARGDPLRYFTMLREFTAAHREDPARLAAGLAAGDYQGVRRLAHGLKGSAGTLGVAALAADAGCLEVLAGEGVGADPGALGAAIDAVRRRLEGLQEVLAGSTLGFPDTAPRL